MLEWTFPVVYLELLQWNDNKTMNAYRSHCVSIQLIVAQKVSPETKTTVIGFSQISVLNTYGKSTAIWFSEAMALVAASFTVKL